MAGEQVGGEHVEGVPRCVDASMEGEQVGRCVDASMAGTMRRSVNGRRASPSTIAATTIPATGTGNMCVNSRRRRRTVYDKSVGNTHAHLHQARSLPTKNGMHQKALPNKSPRKDTITKHGIEMHQNYLSRRLLRVGKRRQKNLAQNLMAWVNVLSKGR